MFLEAIGGVVETTDGRKFQYTLEYDNSWTNENDYLDNVKTDFERECSYPDFGKNEMGLFVEVT